jgi:hypothetical protein
VSAYNRKTRRNCRTTREGRTTRKQLSVMSRNKENTATLQKPPPPCSTMASYGLQVVGYRYQPCSAGCPCRCHKRHHHSTPPVLNRFIGVLFIGYSSIVVKHPRCDESSCYQPSKFPLQVIYRFPAWLLNRAIIIAITQGSFESIQASIALHKIVPQTADIFELGASGDVAGIHAMIKMGKASPHETYRVGGSSLLNVGLSSAHPLFMLLTTFQFAIERGQVQVAKFLLNVGADPLLEDGLGR